MKELASRTRVRHLAPEDRAAVTNPRGRRRQFPGGGAPRRVRRGVGVVMMAGALTLVGFATAPRAVAEAPSATGWWWLGQPSTVVVAPAAVVPEGGLYVAGGFGQPTGVSALRFELNAGDVADTLTLEIAEAVGTPVVVACPTAQPWHPAEGGAWADRPTADCEHGSVTAELSGDGQQLRLDVTSLQDDGVVDIALIPAADEGSSTFSMSIEPLGAEALALQPATDTPAPLGPPAGEEPLDPRPSVPDSPTLALPEPSFPDIASPSLEAPSANLVAAPTPLGRITQGFAYPIVFALPLLLLICGAFLTWVLTRPIAVGPGRPRQEL